MQWIPDGIEILFILGWISVIGFLISKYGKISEFRQQWINALRDDVAALISHTMEIRSGITVEQVDASMVKASEAAARIELRLNPKEEESQALLTEVALLQGAIHAQSSVDQINSIAHELTKTTQAVLRKEWRRIKLGEPLYRWTFRVALICSVAATVVLLSLNRQLLSDLLPYLHR